MKKTFLAAVLAAGICFLFSGIAPAQSGDAGTRGQGMKEARERPDAAGALSDEQKASVISIFSKYTASSLTADDAKAIHRAFRDAGLRGGPALNEAVTSAGFDPEKLRELDPPPDRKGGGETGPAGGEDGRKGSGGPQKYSLEQAISDNAQLHTIAFSGLAFITGDFGASTFIPPGKVCDFFGFQYLRDIDAAGAGHNPKFLDRAAGNVLCALNSEQRALFEKSSRWEAGQLRELAEKRLPLIKAFCRELKGDIPAGSTGLNKDAVMRWVGDIFKLDAELSYRRAQVFGQVAASLTSGQKAYLGRMKFGDFTTWPDVDVEPYKLPRGTEKLVNVAYMTCASEFFSWYAGSLEADTYFCPERHGTYFGGFYLKDMPAMGKRDYNISTSVTGDSGRNFLNMLTAEQRGNITKIPGLQRKDIEEIISMRRSISQQLRAFLSGGQADHDKVIALGRRYGELDGELSFYYATAFATVNKTLTQLQRSELLKLRNLDGYTSAPAYSYSWPLQGELNLPNTDGFFFSPALAAGGLQ